MPNPSIDRTQESPEAPPSKNGILTKVLADYIGQGADSLPEAGPDEPAERQAIVPGVPDLGDVRITYRLNSYKHGRSRRWHWLAVFAEKVG